MKYKLKHHQVIASALHNFNSLFFCKNHIIFGGGTRIAMDIDEYRASVDIDFLCPDMAAYRAVREQINNVSLGGLVNKDFVYKREIMADRYAVRTLIEYKTTLIKLEFVSFDNYQLTWLKDPKVFPVPFLDQASCFYTKLLANSDRGFEYPYKDIFDLIAMRKQWGPIPTESIELAGKHYGKATVMNSLKTALENVINNPDKYLSCASDLSINQAWADAIVKYAGVLLKEVPTV